MISPALFAGVSLAALVVSLDKTTALGSGKTSTSMTITTSSVSASVTGGSTPYSYLWEVTTAAGVYAVSPNTPSTAFRKDGAQPGNTYTGTARLKVTDNLGTIVYSQTVNISIMCREPLDIGGTS